MKIRPVILCGGSGTRLWTDKKHHQPKQFIDFGNWTLFGKTLERIKNSIFDYPIISTNKRYIREIKKHLRLKGFKKYKIILEPAKRNTAPAILSSALIKEIPENQPLIFLTSDHLIEKTNLFNKSIKQYKKETVELTVEELSTEKKFRINNVPSLPFTTRMWILGGALFGGIIFGVAPFISWRWYIERQSTPAKE